MIYPLPGGQQTTVKVTGKLTVADAEGNVISEGNVVVDPARAARGRYGKVKGAANERNVSASLRKKGYNCTKSSASLGAFDIIAINAEHVLCIQVKSQRMPDPAERQAMLAVPLPECGHRLIWRWRPRKAYLLTELLPGDTQVPFSLPDDLPT